MKYQSGCFENITENTLLPDNSLEINDKYLGETLKVHISRLRKKLPESGNAFVRGKDDHHSISILGVGYMLHDTARERIVNRLENYLK